LPTVFLSVSSTLLLFFILTLVLGFGHFLPLPLHMLWGLFLGLLLVLLQCLVFGFFIGSGKTIKKKVQEAGLSGNWVEKTKEYKNRAYPSLMLSILLLAGALAAGGAVSVGFLPSWVHGGLMVLALGFNVRSLWISYRTVAENVQAIHQINRQITSRPSIAGNSSQTAGSMAGGTPPAVPTRPMASNLYFLAMAVWVPFLYMRWSLGDQVFPFWPFLTVSLGLGTLGFWFSFRKRNKS
jgi:hypothetical protein